MFVRGAGFVFAFASGALALVTGCGVADNDPTLWRGVDLGEGSAEASGGGDPTGGPGATSPNGAGGSPGTTTGAGGGTGSPVDSGPCSMTFTVTNQAYGGKYSPKNVGAIWIETANGQFVKTLEVWGAKRLKNATNWVASSGSNTIDAITSATIGSYKTHTETWDCSDTNGAIVPDGAYRVAEEFTSDNSASPFSPPSHFNTVGFTKSADPQTLAPPDAPGFVGQQLDYH